MAMALAISSVRGKEPRHLASGKSPRKLLTKGGPSEASFGMLDEEAAAMEPPPTASEVSERMKTENLQVFSAVL